MESSDNLHPDWLLNVLKESPEKPKKKQVRVTLEQKEILLSFFTENPELITHSSTKESEKALWNELVKQLNEIKPEKSLEFWRMFWLKWIKGLDKKPENGLTIIDYRLKKFLKNVGFVNEEKEKEEISYLTLEEINEMLENISKQKSENKLEIDEMEYKIHRLKNRIIDLKEQLKEKKKLNTYLMKKKDKLCKTKKTISDQEAQKKL